MSKLSLKNKHEVPKIEKIILNMGLGEDASDGKKLKACVDDMSFISGKNQLLQNLKSLFLILKPEKDLTLALKLLRSIKCTNL